MQRWSVIAWLLRPKEKTGRRTPTLRDIQQLYAAAPEDLSEEMRPLVTEEVRKLFARWLGVAYTPHLHEQAA